MKHYMVLFGLLLMVVNLGGIIRNIINESNGLELYNAFLSYGFHVAMVLFGLLMIMTYRPENQAKEKNNVI